MPCGVVPCGGGKHRFKDGLVVECKVNTKKPGWSVGWVELTGMGGGSAPSGSTQWVE